MTDQKQAGTAVTLITADTEHSLVGPTVNQVPIDQLLIEFETAAAGNLKAYVKAHPVHLFLSIML